MGDAASKRGSLLAPFANRSFASLWVASVVSSVGTAMQTVGATWMLVSLHASPGTIALLQAAGSVPLFLFGLPAGVLADIVDRRKLLIAANIWMALSAGVLAIAAAAGLAVPAALIGASFAIGMGAAVAAPAFQAIVPELASGPNLPSAVALNSVGTNIARTVGPALGGIAAGAFGAATVFGINAVSTLAVVVALVAWNRVATPLRLPPEHFWSATRASVRYAQHAPGVRAVLNCAGAFFFFASAGWALLPVVASNRLGLDAGGYGALLGALGVGAVGAALLLGALQARFSAITLIASGNVICALVTLALSIVRLELLGMGLMVAFGAGWIVVLTLLNVGVQASVAGWVRARMLALYVVVYFGTFAIGSLAWGHLADLIGAPFTLAIAGVAGLSVTPVLIYLRGRDAGQPDFKPATTDIPTLIVEPGDDHGAVLVMIDYHVPKEEQAAFTAVLRQLSESRRRTGAFAWRHWIDPNDPILHREAYVVESWTEHLRQRLRRTLSDQELEQAAAAFSDPAPANRLLREAESVLPNTAALSAGSS